MHTQSLCVCLLALLAATLSSPLPTVKTGIKEKFKEFLRKVVYGITPTTIYTTLRRYKFPEEYDPIRVLDWQLREEKRVGLTTPDWEPKLTEVTNLWDGYFIDPTFDDVTFYCMRHLHANDSRPTTVKRYWESEFGDGASVEAIARYWKQEALKDNAAWEATFVTTEYVPLEDLTIDSEGNRYSPNWEESHIESEERRLCADIQRAKDEKYMREVGPYNFNYSPPSGEKTTERSAATAELRETVPPAATPGHSTHKPQEGQGHTQQETTRKTRTPIVPGAPLESESEYEYVDAVPRSPKWRR